MQYLAGLQRKGEENGEGTREKVKGRGEEGWNKDRGEVKEKGETGKRTGRRGGK